MRNASTNPAVHRRFKVGVFLTSPRVPSWVGNVIDIVLAHPNAAAEFLLIDAGASDGTESPRRYSFLFNCFRRLEESRAERWQKSAPERDLSGILESHPVSRIKATRLSGSIEIPESGAREIGARALDVLFDLSGELRSPEKLPATFGVWRYSHGLVSDGRRRDVGFWEAALRVEEVRVALERVYPEASSRSVLAETYVRAVRTSTSLGRARILGAGPILAKWALNRLPRFASSNESFPPRQGLSRVESPKRKRPSDAVVARFFLGSVKRKALRLLGIGDPSYFKWSIAVVEGSVEEELTQRLASAKWHEPLAGGYLADPFLIEHEGRSYVFVEQFDEARDKGHLAVLDLSPDGTLSNLRTILDLEHHLSFPYVFRSGGDIYLLPEEHQRRRVCLYRCTRFPDRWEEHRTLLEDFEGVDSVLLQSDGYWWLFTTDASFGNEASNLCLFFSRSLEGPFEEHPHSPVKVGLYGSRMAGPVFRRDGRLYRPGQNCRGWYGQSIVLHEIVALSPTEYEERESGELVQPKGSPFPLTLHTVCGAGNRTVIDGAR